MILIIILRLFIFLLTLLLRESFNRDQRKNTLFVMIINIMSHFIVNKTSDFR